MVYSSIVEKDDSSTPFYVQADFTEWENISLLIYTILEGVCLLFFFYIIIYIQGYTCMFMQI